jgi:hypothetical protein
VDIDYLSRRRTLTLTLTLTEREARRVRGRGGREGPNTAGYSIASLDLHPLGVLSTTQREQRTPLT